MESNVSVYGVVSVSAGPGPGVVRTGVRTATRDVLVFVSDTYGQASECGRPLLQFLTKSASCGRLEVVPARPNPKYVGQERYGPPKTEDDELKINRDKSRVGTDQCPELRRGRGEAGGKHAQAVPAVKETESTATTTRGRVRRLVRVSNVTAVVYCGLYEAQQLVEEQAQFVAQPAPLMDGKGQQEPPYITFLPKSVVVNVSGYGVGERRGRRRRGALGARATTKSKRKGKGKGRLKGTIQERVGGGHRRGEGDGWRGEGKGKGKGNKGKGDYESNRRARWGRASSAKSLRTDACRPKAGRAVVMPTGKTTRNVAKVFWNRRGKKAARVE
ncbi:hypothetical protein FIBSPDRAFT_890985 [Athelia psychrophila]|uniref:Uncharacterized protein n=1 Tax=Athelia psychrophila TaxID=1759441 RepID=A0A166KCQ6_9AGAM|nr:hypothetical protein FIBSPDRAFT_890985 [Fibularhizoctonia sp. CBS 109695]